MTSTTLFSRIMMIKHQAYLPYMDKEHGLLMNLNVKGEKN